jgi:HK97 gp10 family phage protein
MSLFLHGVPQTKAALARVKVEIEAASPAATRAGAEIVARAMISRAPRDTGRLASSIRVVETSSFGDGATSKVGSDVPYARFVEFGTTFMAAQPFEEEAGNESTAALVTAMASIYKAAIH